MDYLTVALVLFTLGIITLLAEVLLPTGGILVVASLLCFALGVGIILIRGTTMEAVVAIGALAVGLPASGYVAIAAYRRMSLDSVLTEGGTEPLAIAGVAELESLKNRTGKTVSPLRPSGAVEFDGKRIDAMTEGTMLEAGVWVRCVEVKGTKVIVRQMEAPVDVIDLAPDSPVGRTRPAETEGNRDKSADVPNIQLDASPPAPKTPADDFDDLDIGLDK